MTEARIGTETEIMTETGKEKEDQGHGQDLMKEEGGGIKRNGSAAVDQDQVEAGAEVVIRGDGVEAGVGTETVETVINQHMTIVSIEKENVSAQTLGE